MILRFKVEDQTLRPLPTNRILRRGSRKYLKVDFEFQKNLEDYTKTVFFSAGGYSSAVIYQGEPVQVEAYFTQGDFAISIGLVSGDLSYETNDISIALDPSSTAWLVLPPPTDVPAYQQLVQLAQRAEQSALDSAVDSKNAVVAANVSVKQAAEARTIAKDALSAVTELEERLQDCTASDLSALDAVIGFSGSTVDLSAIDAVTGG